MPKTVYLIIYKSPLFPAHWALWIPSEADPNIGKRIHAEGDAATGFRLSFDRNYDIRQESRKHETLVVAKVGAGHLIDTPGNGVNSVDTEPMDAVETVAAKVLTPGTSLVPSTTSTRGTRVEIRNCQTWLMEVVNALHEEGIFDSNAVEVIKTAPKN
ncbi:hypothetical protein E0Z10_g9601 [Xylaria hypoxylon]|uniref:Uncharacterized protein n=1 Tax=Xylaria hypoxylon TaxID=37992 RepID=A0A4Z0Y5T8_9PEZI|nr:hypothetical protein E0Z10_g9601 [Xylaria hypoxylon]